jgi:hypothetical protein
VSLTLAHGLQPGVSRAVAASSSQAGQAQTALWNLATLTTAGGILAACPVSGIQPLEQQSSAMRGIYTATASVLTPGYTVLKAAVAGAGIGVSYWMALISFDRELARGSFEIMGKGDWWLKPGHLTCEQPIRLLASTGDESSPERDAPMPP